MRVVQLLTQSSGGPVDHAVDVATTLARRGHDSHVVGPPSAGTLAARGAGVTWHELHISDKRDLRGAVAVVRRLGALRPDVVHLQDRRAGWIGRLIAPARGGVGCVYTLHGVADGLSDLVVGNKRAAPRRRRDSWYYLHGERWVTAWSKGQVVVPSAAVARYATEHVRLPPERVHVVPNGVDTQRFRAVSSTRSGARLRVGWLGLLVEVKRLDVLLEAIATVPDVELLVAGDGPLRPQVESAIARLGIGERVRLLGLVADVPGFFTRVDAFALSSAAENCPLSLLQAMACGLPVVATSVGGVPEVVRDGVEGLLVAPGDVAAIRAALTRLVADPDHAERLGVAARARIKQDFTLDICVDGLEQVYARATTCAS